MPKPDHHVFILDDETYFGLLRLTELNNQGRGTFMGADAYLSKLIADKVAELNPPKGILEKVRDGEEI